MGKRERFHGFWVQKENQRKFLDDIAKKLNVVVPKDWGKIKLGDVMKQSGGRTLLKMHKFSLVRALKVIYHEVKWETSWFFFSKHRPNYYWANKENLRKAMEDFAKKKEIKNPKDWNKITTEDLKTSKFMHAVVKYHHSLKNALKVNFPEIQWKEEWFYKKLPLGYWNKRENQKEFLEKTANKLKIKKSSDWGNVSYRDFIDCNGGTLLTHYGSIRRVLEINYPEIEWKREWFKHQKRTSNYWKSLQNQTSFLESISFKYSIKTPSDWQKVTLSFIKNKGGHGLLKLYNNSLIGALEAVIPSFKREFSLNSEIQRFAHSIALKLFQPFPVYSNYRHPALNSKKERMKVELDIWIPNYSLALEIHGAHHYRSTFTHNLQDQKLNDLHRRKMCQSHAITLIEVPYWWDRKDASLIASILQQRPDLAYILKNKK